MFRVRWLGLGWWSAWLLAAPAARAAEPPPSYALSWVRAEGAELCPSSRALVLEVERRLGRPVFDAAAARSFEVEVARFGGSYHSEIFVRDEAGRALGHRSLQSDEPGCAALFGATALAIALVIDPEALSREPDAAKAVAAFDVPPAAPPAPPAPVVASPVAALPAPRESPPSPAPAPSRALVAMSMRAQISGGVVPSASPGFGLAFGARPAPRWGLALSGSYTTARSAHQGIGTYELGLTRAGLAVTFDAVSSRQARLVLAAGPSFGAFHVAVVEPVPVTAPGDYLFAAMELGGALQVAVTPGVFVELGGAGLVPLRRQEFMARGQVEAVWSQPWFSGLGFLGLGAAFP